MIVSSLSTSMASANSSLTKELRRAATAFRNAQALFITAGAGMGVDSGLPDFRGPEGFWKAYPPLRKLGLRLPEMSNPSWFDSDPKFAWGFFGHRYNLYAQALPHEGFDILLKWGRAMEHGYFVFTSNVDGHFQKAGYDIDRIVECHGTIHFLQCADSSANGGIWSVPEGTSFDVDMDTLRLRGPLPRGPPGDDSQLARPNILMFDDYAWLSDRTDRQTEKFEDFRTRLRKDCVPSVVVEIGADEL